LALSVLRGRKREQRKKERAKERKREKENDGAKSKICKRKEATGNYSKIQI
jgi:hypothetical protein